MQPLLDRLSFALFALDADARVLSANVAAQRVLAARDALDLVQGTLRALRVRDELRLRALLDAAIARGEALPLAQSSLALERASGAAPYLLQAVAAAAPAGAADAALPRVWLLVADPLQAPRPTVATLMQAWSLTQAEAELALALADGQTVTEHAHRRGISVGTARRHLERTLRKMRVGRQAELVRLTLALSLPLRG